MKIAVSACLVGEKVRFDGRHKRDRFVTDELGRHARFVPFCPEDLAFGTPRPSIRLVRKGEAFSAVTNKDGTDLTEALQESSLSELERLRGEPLCGIVFKSKSPSCGLQSAKAYLPSGHAEGKTDGLFAAMCRDAFPLLPMEEEGRLQDPWLRENFLVQLFAYDAFERFKASGEGMKALVRFHTVNKFLLQAKDERLYRLLGNIAANREKLPFETVLARYEAGFKTAIARKGSIRRNRNVLEHMAGFFKRELTPGEKATLHEQIADYAGGIVPLIVPLSTLKLYARKYETAYLLEQTFLDPYPKALALRSHLGSGR
jgi:uncharacterized protein YbgA (DUF1722 family)/uncharacterized protein YbbK (DUF523 family)